MSYTLDSAHSSIGFNVRHMMIAKVRGSFDKFEVQSNLDPKDLTNSSVRATIDVASIGTGVADRDNHLRSADFFDVENHPNIEFESTSIEQASDGYCLTGKLTIRGVTKPVTLDVEASGPGRDPWGNTRYGFSLSGKIDREAFGLTWNQAIETGGVLVGKTVTIEGEIQLIAG